MVLSILDGQLTALHIKLDYPSNHQLQMVIPRHLFALDIINAMTRVSESCHTCASLQKFLSPLSSQSSENHPWTRHLQPISSGATASSSYFCVLSRSRGVAPAATPLSDLMWFYSPSMVHTQSYGSTWHQDLFHSRKQMPYSTSASSFRRPHQKHQQKSCCRKSCTGTRRRTVRPGTGLVSELSFVVATARLTTSRPRSFLAKALGRKGNQFNNKQIPVNDLQHIVAKHQARQTKRQYI